VNPVTASFNTIIGQMTEVSQREKNANHLPLHKGKANRK